MNFLSYFQKGSAQKEFFWEINLERLANGLETVDSEQKGGTDNDGGSQGGGDQGGGTDEDCGGQGGCDQCWCSKAGGQTNDGCWAGDQLGANWSPGVDQGTIGDDQSHFEDGDCVIGSRLN